MCFGNKLNLNHIVSYDALRCDYDLQIIRAARVIAILTYYFQDGVTIMFWKVIEEVFVIVIMMNLMKSDLEFVLLGEKLH